LEVLDCDPALFSGLRVVFSALDSSVAGELETKFAEAGFAVFSNAKNHRTDPNVPILIPQVNPESVRLVSNRRPTLASSSLTPTAPQQASLFLETLQRAFGVEKVYVTTLQSISGAGYPGAASLDILDNVIPFISGEEEKLQSEPLKILEDDFAVVAQATSVPVTEGHTLCITVQLKTQATASQVTEALQANLPFQEFQAKYPLTLNFESLQVLADRPPQPKLDRMRGHGLTTTVGRVPGGGAEFQLVAVSHNTLAGAAFGSIKNAELALEAGFLSS
jgi:aspartate-semialdehyde dehydrogenase